MMGAAAFALHAVVALFCGVVTHAHTHTARGHIVRVHVSGCGFAVSAAAVCYHCYESDSAEEYMRPAFCYGAYAEDAGEA